MKDKRKIIFCFICIVIIVISEFFLYKKAYNEDIKYKEDMKNLLEPIASEIESRGFVKSDENDYENGYLSLKRISNDSGKIELKYDLKGKIKDIYIYLEYSADDYSDDVYSDVYYVLGLVGIDLYEKQYMDALNILIENPTQSNKIDKEIKQSKIIINGNEYTLSLKKIKNEYGENKIQFCLE